MTNGWLRRSPLWASTSRGSRGTTRRRTGTAFDSVVIRSTWDYTKTARRYLRWVDSVGPRLHNSPEIVRWNSDKHYLGDLAAGGSRWWPRSTSTRVNRCPL